MNFVLGFLILVSGGNEIDVFWAFVQLVRRTKYLLIGVFLESMPLLSFLEFVTENLLEQKLPKFNKKFQDLGIPPASWLSKWYMTVFLYSFPVNICTRIWDFFLLEGIFGLVKIVVPILKVFYTDFLAMDGLDVKQICDFNFIYD